MLSIDDLYLPHQAQQDLAEAHPDNALVQHRGQPSTHDLALALSVLSDLAKGNSLRLPVYDKSAFNGQGDRIPQADWPLINAPGQTRTRIVILEGWCVGFRALSALELRRRWGAAVLRRTRSQYEGRLGFCKLEDVEFVNDALRKYDELTDQFHVFIHVDAASPTFVYRWRMEQEKALWKSKGCGMTEDQVTSFINGYYPAYELYTDDLRREGMKLRDHQLKLTIGPDRELQEINYL